jgi:cell division protease FtsH
MFRKPDEPTVRRYRRWGVLGGVLVALIMLNSSVPKTTPPKSEALSVLVSDIAKGRVAEIYLNDATQTVVASYKDGQLFSSGYPLGYGTKMVESYAGEVKVVAAPLGSTSLWRSLFLTMVPVLFIVAAMAFFLRASVRGRGLGLGVKGAMNTVPATRFGDVGGVDEVVEELEEVVAYLHDPGRFVALGAKVPRGVLLVGPPGTGKTLLAKAVAGEAGVAFFALSGSDFVDTFVGVGASRVRQVFEKARKAGKAIVFIDELDAVGRARGAGPSNGATEESDRTLNALLVEMDGFAESGVIVLGATNRPEVLDPALLRSGRFDRKITIGAPDRRGRAQILGLLVRGKSLGSDVDLGDLAGRTSSMTGADLGFLVNEAALAAGREGASAIFQRHFIAALEVVAIGRARTSMVVSEQDRRLTAWHEAGHAVVAFALEGADNPVLVSIVPRGSAGGVTWMDADDRHFVTRSRAMAQLSVYLGGRAGEEVLVGDDFTSGVASDLRAAGQLAHTMVTQWAMSALGAHWASGSEHAVELETAEVDRLLAEALDVARATLATYGDLHAAMAEKVLEMDVLGRAELSELVAEYAPDLVARAQ